MIPMIPMIPMINLSIVSGTHNLPVIFRHEKGPYALFPHSDPREVYGIWNNYSFTNGEETITISTVDYSYAAWADYTYLWGASR